MKRKKQPLILQYEMGKHLLQPTTNERLNTNSKETTSTNMNLNGQFSPLFSLLSVNNPSLSTLRLD
jgi:hypothetical protein